MVNMVKIIASLLTILTLVVAGNAYAGKIVVLDMQELFSNSPQAKAAKKRLDTKFQPKKDQLEKKQLDFKQKGEKYARDKDILSAQDKKKQEKELQNLRVELDNIAQTLENEYAESQAQEMEDFVKTVKQVASNIAKQEDSELVMPAHLPVFYKENLDVTDKVMKELNKLSS